MTTDIWIKTQPTIDGKTYAVTIEAGEDNSFGLDPTSAMEYAMQLLKAVQYADYDAAVIAQLNSRVGDHGKAAVGAVQDLRADRPDAPPVGPLSFVPGVSHRTGKGFLTIHLNGKPVGQWDLGPARLHALSVLEAVISADLDAAYHRYLTGTIGLEDGTARAAVDGLATFREDLP